MCDTAKNPIDTIFKKSFEYTDRYGRKRSVLMEVNYTQNMMVKLGRRADWLFQTYFDEQKVTKETCMDNDCLHPCYNTQYTMHCPKCWYEINKASADKSQFE